MRRESKNKLRAWTDDVGAYVDVPTVSTVDADNADIGCIAPSKGREVKMTHMQELQY